MIEHLHQLIWNDNLIKAIFTISIVLIVISLFIIIIRYFRVDLYVFYIGFPRSKYRLDIERDVKIPMLDGVYLAADVYRPRTHGKYPVILVRTPYNKNGPTHPYKQFGELFASQGYVVVVQDVRGKYGSDGKFLPYFHEALDGHSTINWAGNAHWSNGNVALVGISYLGSCAWLAAQFNNPYLRTIIPMFTSQDTYSIWMGSGMPFLKGPLYWLSKYCEKNDNNEFTHLKLEPILWKLPVSELDVFSVNHQIPFYREYLAHPLPDQFWEMISVNHKVEDLNIPALIIGGWYDPFLNGTIEDYQRMMKSTPSKNQNSELLIGPWAHNPSQEFKNINFGKNADLRLLLIDCLNWCDHWLKENMPDVKSTSKVRYFIMGINKWKGAQQWPPENVIEEKYFLSIKEQEKKKDSKNGRLSKTLPTNMYSHQYIFNPRDPVLFRGGYLLYGEDWIAPVEQDEFIARNDVLIYTSNPLEEELVIAGSVKLVLFVSSTALDTDFCAKLCDMHPGGKTYNLTSGFLRMRYRESLKAPKLMEKDKIYRVEIPFRPIANAFLKNHRIQLQVTSSDFPVHNRNLNTGMSCESSIEIKEAEQTIYFGGIHDSYLLLPTLKN